MKLFFSSLLFVSLLFSSTSYSQGEGVMPFTTMQQSSLLLGAGQIGVSVPNDDVLGYYFNPAILGYSARKNHVSISLMPDKTIWMKNYQRKDVTFNNYGFNLGYNLRSTKLDLPISIGVGYLHNKFDYGEYYHTTEFSPEIIGESQSYDQFNSFSLGIGINYFIKFNIGVSLKSYESQLPIGPSTNNNLSIANIDGTMIDYGAMLILPISELLLNEIKYQVDNSLGIKPFTNFSIGYSASNLGDEVYYVDESQKDPLYRTARLGYTFELGFDLLLRKTKINFINYSFSAEANDVLIEPRNEFNNGINYQSGIGDIDISKNLIQLISNDKVIVHRGHIFKFFDTLILTSGRFAGRGYQSTMSTDGIGFTSKGLFKLLNSVSDNSTINYLTEHFEIEYFDSNYLIGNMTFGFGTVNFDMVSIHFVGFEI